MKKLKKVKRVSAGKGRKVPKKYTTGSPQQAKEMADEIDKFKGDKSKKAYKQWEADTNKKTGKAYKTKPSKSTKKFKEKFG